MLNVAGFTQNHDILFHPSFRDEFLTTQVMPGGGLRVFFIADQNNGWTFREVQYMDISPDGASTDSLVTIFTPEGYINYFVQNAFVIRLDDGSAILADNFFDCDYGYAGSIYRLSPSGDIVWWHYLFEDLQVTEVMEMGFVDDEVLGLSTWGPVFRLDLNGVPVGGNEYDQVPDLSVQTPFGYLLGYSDSLVIRDTSFEQIQWYLLEGDILSIDPFDTGSYRIKTTDKYYELDPDFTLTWLPLEGASIWSSVASYWQYTGDHQRVIQYDTSFLPVDTLPLPPGVKPLTGTVLDEHMITLSAYSNEMGQGLVAFTDPEPEVNFNLPKDLGITDIAFPDTVIAEYFNSTVPWSGWSYTYDWLDVLVANFGASPDSVFFIQGDALLDCFWWCYAPVPFWKVDSLLLLPGDQAWVRLPGFTTRCDWQSFNPSICISTVAPDERADGNYLNDAWCESFDFVLNEKSPVTTDPFIVFPNPASEEVTIIADVPGHTLTTIQLVSISGVLIKTLQLQDQRTTIPLDDVSAGIYFLKATVPGGPGAMTKIVVLR